MILLTGVVANAGNPGSLTGKYEALPFHIYYLAAEYQGPAELAQAFASALMLVLPTIVLIVDQQFAQVAAPIRLTATALGLSPAQQLLRLIIPLSRRGLAAAAALGFARAVGDTLLPLMLAGNAVKLPQSLLDPLRTLTSHIALVVATDSQSVAYHSLFACGVLLFGFSIAVNLALHRLRARPEACHGA